MTGLVLTNVTIRSPGGSPLFAPLTFGVRPGEIVSLSGPSGIGKSTLVAHIGGHLPAGFVTAGQVTLDGRNALALPAEARRIGVLFQDALLFPHLSVGENLAFGLEPAIRGRAARRAAVEEALEQAGLAGFYRRDPATLSGGQQARAALMRTLLAAPRAILLDEPFSKLDPALRAELRSFVFAHVRARAVPVLMVSHDAEDAAAAGGPVISLSPA
ncbi:MAG: ATP-binding cassette domain-containing protein [Rhodobacteraceae bacterium]|nr:ATP-binding cassette domain-containing protein [Paracoccaceae bacterium]